MSTQPLLSTAVPMMFHPTLVVDDLPQATEWFQRVFGRRGVRWEEKYDFSKLKGDYPKEYSIFIHLGDVVVDVLSPKLLALPEGKKAPYPEGQGLTDIAWYTEDARALASYFTARGIRVRDQNGSLVENGDLPVSNLADDCYILWTLPEDTGLTYEFLEMGEQHREFYSLVGDPRLNPSWTLPVASADDPLGVVRSLHHTILTLDLDRAERLYTCILPGRVIRRGTDTQWGAESVSIEFAGSVLKFARPQSDALTDVFTGEPTETDSYVGMTYQVLDLERVARHLTQQGVGFERVDEAICTFPAETMGVRWTFVENARP
ncbi:VOC family protein [Arthrobacter sp. I2-34]|uniref:VOC family protein n=1 Tax=Arthrobacter hankyongi TaxID=2904801 RepID=A0ABS9LBR9_9MICC|nr:VOC family protein [Arthrobacter hankyongi]MCG2624116.1 VOC family protein [Arthrobacter hankyongi]